MRRLKIVVSNGSVLVDLTKARLIEPVVSLPFEFMIPDVILAHDLLDLGTYTAAKLLDLGFVKGALEGADARCATDYFLENRRKLSFNDCFAWRMAEVHKAILLTGEPNLGAIASAAQVEVRGLLWAVEMIAYHKTSTNKVLAKALERLANDPLVGLPEAETSALRDRLRTG